MTSSGRRLVILLLAALTLTVVMSCIRPTDDTADIANGASGTVTDSITGEPIESVFVVLGDTLISAAKLYTDSIGGYTIIEIGIGTTFTISAMKSGYASSWRVVTAAKPGRIVTGVDFRLVPSGQGNQ